MPWSSPLETHFTLSAHFSGTSWQAGGRCAKGEVKNTHPKSGGGHLKVGRGEMTQNQETNLVRNPSKGLRKLESVVSREAWSATLLQMP